MDTLRVDIAYRPLRVVWAIHSSDHAAFRRAVRLTHRLWGGRFNPIVLVDRPAEAKQLIEMFRGDVICPIGESPIVKQLSQNFPHLNHPALEDVAFRDGWGLLDVRNAVLHWQDTEKWKSISEEGLRVYEWDEDDPLTDVFLMQHGRYPDATELEVDYAKFLSQATTILRERIEKAQPIPASAHPNIHYLARRGLYILPVEDSIATTGGFGRNGTALDSMWETLQTSWT